jgi:membrane-bound lytic murein transglycosylase B
VAFRRKRQTITGEQLTPTLVAAADTGGQATLKLLRSAFRGKQRPAFRRKRLPTPGERFTAIVTALGAVLLPITAFGGDAQMLAPALVAHSTPLDEIPTHPKKVGADGRVGTASTPTPQFLAELAHPDQFLGQAIAQAHVPAGQLGIPGTVLNAYLRAAQSLGTSDSACGLHWSVLAGIGRIESNHAHNGDVDAAGTTRYPILGPELNGTNGYAAYPATPADELLDFDPVWDRAVGPMQFIPSTWRAYAPGPGTSPHNVNDAALAAGRFLCAGGGNLRDPAALAAAVFRYNPSEDYVREVLAWAARYSAGVIPLPPGTSGDVAPASLAATVRPVGGSPGGGTPFGAPAPGPAPAPAPAPAPVSAPPPPPGNSTRPSSSNEPPPPPPSATAAPPPSATPPPTTAPEPTTTPTPTPESPVPTT